MRELVINAGSHETRIAELENKRLVELQVERHENPSIVGNIYKGRIDSVVPGIQAAFIDIGQEKNGFLYVSDIAGAEGTGDMMLEEGKPRARTRARRAKQQPIETMLKKGQHIMVQVVKDRLGNKGARLTNFITIPGRYTVLMPTVSTLGVSRKIGTEEERDRLKKVLRQIRPKGMGLITRTAGEGRPREDFQADAKYHSNVWENIKTKYERMNGPGLIREDLSPILRAVRDRFTHEFDRLTVDDEEQRDRIVAFLDSLDPDLKGRVRLYKHRRPLFDKMGIEDEITKALRRQVYLPSGGHICIDQTEALIAIDVNTGKFTGKKQLEDTVFQTNIEAASEIARQMRLRDMGGIIVIDFIDMDQMRNRKKLLKALYDALKADRAKTTVSEINELGMIEMTRKRVKHNLVKALSQPCPYCEGSGQVRSVTTMTFDTLRKLQSLFVTSKEKHIVLQVHPDVARRLRQENKGMLDEIAERFGREISVESVSDFHIHDTKVLRARNRDEITAHSD
ncbi:MAG: Rne/Rng family ribonuclease [Candidatus Hydrogenedentes bacterium]|nr:Rne/Rng family ribonuclease [Candidatus Hydrogenedentota bacterium]